MYNILIMLTKVNVYIVGHLELDLHTSAEHPQSTSTLIAISHPNSSAIPNPHHIHLCAPSNSHLSP